MREIFSYIKKYLVETDKFVLIVSIVFISICIFLNYYLGIDQRIKSLSEPEQFANWYLIFLSSFSFGYLVRWITTQCFTGYRMFYIFLLMAPAIFAWKMAFTPELYFSVNALENSYWQQVLYWPFKVLIITTILFIIWKIFEKDKPFYGLKIEDVKIKPYLIMLLMMVPLVFAASTQPDFQSMYPKFQKIEYLSGAGKEWHKLLYELSYGSDFFSIELFFRGFLILGFMQWVDKDAILPMALFYCTIHFGKPMGECISSFFGGIILGVIVYHTRTIWGGLMVHLGIAWIMELAGYLASP